MKMTLLLPFILALPASAGTSAKEVVAPVPNPCLFSWFAGGSAGYLTELEGPMYNLHVGVTNNCWKIAGWNVGLFAEIGYADTDQSFDRNGQRPGAMHKGDSYTLDQLNNKLQTITNLWPQVGGGPVSDPNISYDLSIMPITLNVKLERALVGKLNGYVGAGLGVARVNFDYHEASTSWSDADWVFTSQVFAGLSYQMTPGFEVYGGGRWIYLGNASFNSGKAITTVSISQLELGSDCLLELGVRCQF